MTDPTKDTKSDGLVPSSGCEERMENLARFETSDTSAVEPVIVRAGRPTHISNDYFEGTCFLFVRDPAVHVSTQDTFCRRYFEIQLQGRFKRTPERFFIGLELSEVLRLSMLMRGVCNTLFNFVRSYEPDICVSFGSAKGGIDYEMPHLVSPYFKGCDIVVETPDGEAPPTLGTDITGGRTHPKGGRPMRIRLDCTYTICTFSTCIDPFAWKVKGTPVGTVDIGSVIGRDTAIRIVMYALQPPADAGIRLAHANAHKAYMLCVQLEPPARRRAMLPSPISVPADAATAESGSLAVTIRRNSSYEGLRDAVEAAAAAAATASEALKPKKRRKKKRPGPGNILPYRPGSRAPLPMDSPGSGASNQNYPNLAGGAKELSPAELEAHHRLVIWMAGQKPSKRTARRHAAAVAASESDIRRNSTKLAETRRCKLASEPRSSRVSQLMARLMGRRFSSPTKSATPALAAVPSASLPKASPVSVSAESVSVESGTTSAASADCAVSAAELEARSLSPGTVCFVSTRHELSVSYIKPLPSPPTLMLEVESTSS